MSIPPLASIIIVTYNGLVFTRRCLQSVMEHTGDVPSELIIVDNCSTDGTPEFLRSLPQVTAVTNAENRGFAGGCSQGLRLARGDYLVLLNPDTVVTEGWLARLIAHAKRHPDVGAVGPLSNQTGELQYDSAAESQYDGLDEMQAYANRTAARNRGKSFEFHRAAGFCLLLKREVLERVGYLDEQFGSGFYEDDDYCKRLRKAGYRILIAQDVFIYHEGGSSFVTLAPGATNRLMMINRGRFLAKWAGGRWFTKMPPANLPQPAVSVIIATRNRPHLLRHAVASALAQTFRDFELLVVHDGEVDLSAHPAELIDPRIRQLRSPGSGKSAALNFGLRAARGEYIAYLDDDDLYYPWHLETLTCALLSRPAYRLAYTDTVVADCFASEDGHRTVTSQPVKWEHERAVLWEQNNIPNLAVMHHRSLADQAGGYDEGLPMFEDWAALRRFSCFTDFLHVPVITAEWHRHINVVTRNEPSFRDRDLKEDTVRYIKGRPLPAPGKPTAADLVSTAQHAEASGLLEVAANTHLAVLRMDPLNFAAGLGSARCLGRLGWRARIKPILRQVIESRPDLPDGYIAYADELLRRRPSKEEVIQAKEALEFALLADPGDKMGDVYIRLADCYWRLGRRDTAHLCRAHGRKLMPRGPLGRFLNIWRREGMEGALGATARALRRVVRSP